MGEKCKCGRFHIDPVPFECSRCHEKLKTGCMEGESYRVVNRPTIQGTGPVRTSTVKFGGLLGKAFNQAYGVNGEPRVIDRKKVDDEYGQMNIEWLSSDAQKSSTSDWRSIGNDGDNRDTGNLPRF